MTLPETSERPFSSGAPRYYVASICFAYVLRDRSSLAVRVDSGQWEALHMGRPAVLTPMPLVAQQRARYASIELAAADPDDVRSALIDAWRLCAPARLRTDLATHDDLLDALRLVAGLREKGKHPGSFHHRSRAFLHFHVGDAGRYADVRFLDEWEPLPAETPSDRRRLLDAVERHVGASVS